MSPRAFWPRRWGLRARLVVPMLILVLLGGATLAFVSEQATDRQVERLVNVRGATVLEGITEHLEERQRAKVVFAQLLADQSGLAATVERADKRALAQLLVPLQVKLGLQSITVYSSAQAELLHLGPRLPAAMADSLVRDAVAGLTTPTTTMGGEGLSVAAASPVKGAAGIVGAIVVGATLNDDDLKAIGGRESVELALFWRGTLVATTAGQPQLARALAESSATAAAVEALHRSLDPLRYHATARSMGDEGLLVTLVPTEDIVEAATQRRLAGAIAGSLLTLLLAVAALSHAQAIARPVQTMVTAAREIAQGHYDRRVAPTGIRELDELAEAYNHLAQQVETQLSTLTHQAFYDPLTGLPNRLLLLDRLERALARAARRRAAAAVMLLDLDNFKFVNDSWGHQVGDRLLVDVAGRLQACLRAEDTAARLGGDEFALLLEGVGSMHDAVRAAERVAGELRAPFLQGKQEVYATASIGIALSTEEHERPEDLLRHADVAMYQAKLSGKARYALFDRDMSDRARARLALETELRRALERGEFRIHYQPIVNLEAGQVRELEALVRWQHPTRGLVAPAEFIPLAEETGLILPLGQWVLEQACRQARLWHEQHPYEPPLTMSVNLSARQFHNPRLTEDVARSLRETGLSSTYLKLELTESAIMQDAEGAVATLRQLKAMGVQLALDDFGTGYSSLAYLQRFPIDTLKIDRSFVERLGHNPHDTAIVRTIVALARALRLAVTGEGVETSEQLSYLRELGCDQGQGYYLAQPLPSDAAGAWLAARPEAQERAGGATPDPLSARIPAAPATVAVAGAAE